MSLLGVADRLSAEEIAREPRSLGVLAYFDGYAFGSYGRTGSQVFPRRLNRAEERSWREGFTEGRTERVCHSWHGFTVCAGNHPPTINPDPLWKRPL